MANREWIFKQRPGPEGFKASDLELRECPVPSCGENQVLLATHLMSMDPTMRNAMAGEDGAARTGGSAYWAFMNWTPGKVVEWTIAGVVLESKAEGFAKGEVVVTSAPWREINAVEAETCRKIPEGVAPSAAFSCLELTAKTGFCGVKFVARPKAGDVAYVSGAAGATGLVACHTFKNLGCRVIGSAGTKEKVEMLQAQGFEAFNYKEEPVLAALKRIAPDGLNVCFDNVGGETLEAMLDMLNDGGSVALCGAISQYDLRPEARSGVRNLFQAVAKKLRIEGFLLFQFTPEELQDCRDTMLSWMKEGKISDCCTFVDGFENLPDGILGLFQGTNTGKMLVRVPVDSKL
ncbi:unnamed protein product [Effrenium voratum]|uniref:Enoyl reductase (ER) domain-containing protein n=1 Tax=Effrenium voratum TaxID=2562239 RepID=A0AA36IHP5_9DINO|nr:unnamed protein product [Effrenium voratum]